MNNGQADVIKQFSWKKVGIWLALGLGISLYLIITTFKPEALKAVTLSRHLVLGLLLAALTVVVRDAAYVFRIRELTGKKLSWGKAFEVVMLWEFGSAITPGAVGGIALAFFVLEKEGISYGRSGAMVMLTTFIDNLAFVTVFTLMYFLLGNNMFVVSTLCPDLEGHQIMQGIRSLADKTWIGYVIMLSITVLLGLGIFVFPHTAKNLLHRIANWKILSRLKNTIIHQGEEIELASNEFKSQTIGFWAKITSATFISWIARYLLANALLFAFANVDLNMTEVLARQYLLWLFLIIPSTPGASGLAEVSFVAMNCEFIPVGLSAAIALIWRMYNYYLYLIIGAIILPKWLKRVA